ncbi:hypothetical protein [Glycomyces tritici]|uniref:Uncharacterized protein n=1 Tax=Glycomyces tritici TaxID=2665176 RepID=A0ABT7YYK5_9ACTN|nr:hypothetical protein [Glycomyces tritici]MDN3241840.1 hypothetical protein [Glycomyces tritici]MDN3243691.1 hypothetical protein [Glycomyces tritici]
MIGQNINAARWSPTTNPDSTGRPTTESEPSVSSTTIRYSGVPENSHSRRFDPDHTIEPTGEPTSGMTADSTIYSRPAPAGGFDRGPESDLTLKWRKRLRALADEDPATDSDARPQDSGPSGRSQQGAFRADRSGRFTDRSDQAENPVSSGYDLAEGCVASGPDLIAEHTATDPSHTSESATDFVPGFTPGKAGPISPDPRHNRAFPHPQNPGLFADADGFYDWANRRPYLADGSPDPLTPGAYRYQTRPDLCDLDAPDSDPSSPRYEPMHLRHKPGDDWLIDNNRPYDVLDPGPFGSPEWFPDRRTGRHRRDELPDPIPWWETEEEPEKAEWAKHAEALYDRRTRTTREREAREDNRRDDTDPPEPPSRQSAVSEERPHRQQSPRPQPWSRSEPEAREPFHESSPSQTRPQRRPHLPRQADRRTTGIPEEPPHRFEKLREDAWDRFIDKSADLAAAHRSPAAIERECGPTIGRIARGIRLITGLLRHRPKPRDTDTAPPDQRTRLTEAVRPDRHAVLAARTARFAGAVRGAQRARTGAPPLRMARADAPGGAAWA